MNDYMETLEANLLSVLREVQSQPQIGDLFPAGVRRYSEQMEQIREYIEDAGEYGIAYEVLVSLLENFPFQISGSSSIKLLEAGLLMGFKSEDLKDVRFDRRRDPARR